MVNAALQDAATMAVRRNFNTVGSHGIVYKLRGKLTRHIISTSMRSYLVVIRRQLVQTFLDNVVTVQVLDQRDNVQTERDDYSMNLSIVSKISLLLP
jgi:hypothetical protein